MAHWQFLQMFYLPGFHFSSVTQSITSDGPTLSSKWWSYSKHIVREDSFSDSVQRNVPGTFRGVGVLFLDVSVKIEIIDFLQPRIKQKLQENIIIIPEKCVDIDYAQP